MTEKRVRVGVLGTGGMARRRLKALDRLETAEAVWVASRSRPRAEELAAEFGIEGTAAWPRRLERGDVDAVAIALPNALHREAAERAFEAGMAVLVEYPIADHPDAGRTMCERAGKAGLLLHVGLTPRLSGHHRAIGEALAGLGDWVSYHVFQCTGSGGISRWYGQKELMRNAFVASHVHFIDELMAFFGQPAWVDAALVEKPGEDGRLLRDCGTVMIGWPHGGTAQVLWARGWVPPGLGARQEVIAENGYLVWEDGRLRLRTPEVDQRLPVAEIDAVLEDTRLFVDALREEGDRPYDEWDALASLEVAEAAWVAASEGRRVEVGTAARE